MIDTHAHIQDSRYENIDTLITNAKKAGVDKIICASADLDSSKKACLIASSYNEIYATVGVHPEEAGDFTDESLNELEMLSKNNKVVAIGEIGLDYHYIFASKEVQKEVFLKQINLADKLNMPIVIHSRDATGDMMEIIRANLSKLKNGVCFHCFNMSLEILKEIMAYGFYISIGGIVTFKNANNILDIARECDVNRLMLETDSPYLTPVPHRSKTNEPAYVALTAEKIAELKNMSVWELDEITTKNAVKFFRLEGK